MGRTPRSSYSAALAVLGFSFLAGCPGDPPAGSGPIPPFTGEVGTILFVTQVPLAGFQCVSSAFGNHEADMGSVPRGGDLMIRYPDGTLRNLTREAGFGMTGLQGDQAIAVRQPAVHWDGNKAVFSMVVGAPAQFEYNEYRWQLYEVTGLGRDETVSITLVPNQPTEYNNVAPTYATDDRIIFASDRPRDGEAHLYPLLDEYESAPTVTGLWSLDPGNGDLRLLNHAPSGVFSPSVDSFGRVIFTKWDHLQRDQQADAERADPGRYGAFTYADESAGAARIASLTGMEVFPEPRSESDPDADPNVSMHTINQFLPWEVNEDGTGEETLNHVGRHELGGSFVSGSFMDDPNLTYLTPESTHVNRYDVGGDGGMFFVREDAKNPGTYYAIWAPEFGTAGAGAVFKFAGGPSVNPEAMELIAVTDRASYLQPESPSGAPGSTGHYRNPLPMSDGTLIVSHTAVVTGTKNLGSRAQPDWNYAFRLRVMKQDGALWAAGGALTEGITADVTYFDPDVEVSYGGLLWELDPVEVAPRTRPEPRVSELEAPELSVFADTGVDVAKLRAWLIEHDLALIISRNVTSRDRADVQQPFNLRVPGGVSTIAAPGTIYDVSFLQVFQGDAVRGYGGTEAPAPGRRVLARPMHGPQVSASPGGPAGSVALGLDGSMAAFVPARRALSWQLTGPSGDAVVRERNWVSFQAGEIRTCPVCHGLNTQDQLGGGLPTNPPQALQTLLETWAATQP